MSRKRLVVLLAACLLLAGCGKDAADTVVTTGDGGLGASLARTAEVTTYRVSSWTAQTIELPFAGISSTTEIDEKVPTVVAEISPDRQHFLVDLSPILSPIAGENIDIKFEIWSNDERYVIDTRDYQQLLDQTPGASLGPFAPGIAFIDLTELEEDGPELVSSLVGSSLPDLRQLAETLAGVLTEIEQISTDPPTYKGITTFSDLTRAHGQDISDTARGAAAALALNLPIDIEELTNFYVDFYSTTEAEVTIELDERGLLHVLSDRVDISDLYSKLFELEAFFAEVPESERQAVLEDANNSLHVLETRTVYEADSDLEVPLPPDTTDDRTDLWKEFLSASGSG